MPLVLLALGLGSLFAWGLARAKKQEEEHARRETALPPAREPFPWEAAAPIPAPRPAAVLPGAAISVGPLGRKYDAGLSDDEVAAIVYARAKEPISKNLDDFADTLDPDYPIAVLRLREQARQLRRAVWRQPASAAIELASARLSTRLASRFAGHLAGEEMDESDRRWSTFYVPPIPNLPGRPVLEDPVENVDFVPGDREGWDRAREKKKAELEKKLAAWKELMAPTLDVLENTKIPVARFEWGLGGPATGPADWVASHPTFMMPLGEALREVYYNKEAKKNRDLESAGFFAGLLSLIGKALKAVASVYTASLKYVAAPVLSYIPGLGTAAAAIVTVGAEIAMGEPVNKALVDGAAAAIPAPGGIALKMGVRAIEAAAKGERFDAVLLTSLRDGALAALPADVRALGPLAETIVDTGIAMAQAKDLQDVGFVVLRRLARGNSLVEQSADFADQMTKAAQADKPVEDLLKANIALGLTSVPQPAAKLRALLSEMSKDPALLKKTPAELAASKGVPEPLAHAALATVRELPIPKWMGDVLGIGAKNPILYVDMSLVSGLVPPLYMGMPSFEVMRRAEGTPVYAKLKMREQWVSYYKNKLNLEAHPYLRASSSSSATLKGFS